MTAHTMKMSTLHAVLNAMERAFPQVRILLNGRERLKSIFSKKFSLIIYVVSTSCYVYKVFST